MQKSPPKNKPHRSVIHRLVRVFIKIVASVLIILILVIILIQTPFGQNIIRSKAETYLSRKLKTRVVVGNLYIKFPQNIVLKNIYLEDRQKDTLLSAGLVDVQIRMWGLLHNSVDIREVKLADMTVKIKRQLPDTAFNFQFIADAFSGGATQEPVKKDSSAPMKFALQELLLDRIRLVYKDVVTGNDVEAWIDHSQTEMPVFDPMALRFSVSNFQLSGLRATVRQNKPMELPVVVSNSAPVTGSNSSSSNLQLQLGTIDVQNSYVDYANNMGALSTTVQVGKLSTKVKTFDLTHQVINLGELRFDSSTAVVRLGPGEAVKVLRPVRTIRKGGKDDHTPAADTTAVPWRFTASSVQLNGNDIRFDDNEQPKQKAGMDYAHLKFTDLTLHAANLGYNKDSISGELTEGHLREQSGLDLQQLHVAFLYTDKQTLLQNLLLRTPGTYLQRSVSLRYTSLASLMKDPAHTLIDLDMPNSKIAVKDVLLFAPMLESQPALHAGDVWQINARVKGSLAALRVETLQFSGMQDIRVDLAGTILNPLDTQRVAADLTIRNISGSRKGIEALVAKGMLPSNIAIPAYFNLRGKLKGGMTGANMDLALNTSSGNVKIKGFVQQFRDAARASYDLVLQAKDLNLGAILKDSAQFGKVTADFTAKGRGFDPQTANASLHGRILSAVIRKYNYKEFLFDGSIADRRLELQSSIHNEAIGFDLKASGELPPSAGKQTAAAFPSLRLDWQIDTLDLRALHLVTDTLQFKGHIGADFASTDPDALDGKMVVGQIDLISGAQRFTTDSLVLVALHQGDSQTIQFHSEMADLDWRGHYKLTEAATALQHTINDYYRLNGFSDTTFTAQSWQMQLHLRPSPLVLAYMPSLKGTDSAFALMTFNSEQDDLRIAMNAPKVQFGSQSFLNTVVTASTTTAAVPAQQPAVPVTAPANTSGPLPSVITSVPDSSKQLNYKVQIAEGNGAGFEFHQTTLQGYLSNNKLFTSLMLKDAKGKDRYHLAGLLDKLPDGLRFALHPDSLMLNYEKWDVSRDNYVQYDSAGIAINDLVISNSDQSLRVGSEPVAANAPVKVAFTNFRLNTFSRFANQDSLGVDGTLNGQAEVKNMMSSPVFTSDLSIRGLSYKADTVGDLTVKVNNETANAFAAEIGLKGNQNDVEVSGKYYTGDQSRMDLKLDLRQLNLASVKPFASSQVEDIKGFLKGNLSIQGSLDAPKIAGGLHFDSTMITPTMTGEPLKISKDNIEFDADGFNFSKFSMEDSAGNKATIDGNVFTKNYRDYAFDISVNADNFRAVNAPASNARLFYGKMNLDMAVNLTGDMNAPKIDGDLRVNKRTNFYFVLPGSNPEISSREGVIRFIDHHNPGDTLILTPIGPIKEIVLQGVEVSMNIQTDSSAIFTVVIDERNGDALTVRGRSNLVFGMDRNGRMELTGGYEVESGSYNLSFNVLKRKFDIVRGSTITWTGDPLKATVDISANYTALTPSIDLIENEFAGRADELTKFKQKLPFLVTLKMEGDLMKPKITFDISLPPNVLTLWPDVDQKLQQVRVQESELNKQVFALLLLNRFVGENPLQSSAGGGSSVGNLAFQSASQILTNQLDQLAGSLIKGVDIHFDLNNQQDFTTGKENDYTELNVTVSKALFNERVTVNVGSNFDVQGSSNNNQSASNLAGDVAVDYKLTQDGRYMVRAYRKNQYQAVVEGQVVESGVSFILTFDYNKFREIFKRTREEKLAERSVSKPVPAPKTAPTQDNKPNSQPNK